MEHRQPTLTPRAWLIVGALTAIALIVRIALAQGELWLDEVWSAVHARAAATPLGVFLGINHDNNHHLNSLWMQAVEIDAPPVLQRALAIATGTAAVPVAALLARCGGSANALLAAALFALSPFLAHYGSEARGYAPMILALLVVMLQTDRWLAGAPRPTLGLALWTVLGLLSQLTMAVGLVAIVGWALFARARSEGPLAAARETMRGFAPAAIAGLLVVGGIVVAARVESGAMRFGAYEAYTLTDQWRATVAIIAYPIGAGLKAVWPVALVLPLLGLATWLRVPRIVFAWLALLAFPLAVAVLHPANPGHPRYYAVTAVALLLLIADVLPALWRRGGLSRLAAGIAAASLLIACIVEDARLAANQRADVGRAVALLRGAAPGGTTLLVEEKSVRPVVALAARHAAYPLRIVAGGCPAPPFLFIDQYNDQQFELSEQRCGRRYVPIAQLRGRGMANMHWALYRRE